VKLAEGRLGEDARSSRIQSGMLGSWITLTGEGLDYLPSHLQSIERRVCTSLKIATGSQTPLIGQPMSWNSSINIINYVSAAPLSPLPYAPPNAPRGIPSGQDLTAGDSDNCHSSTAVGYMSWLYVPTFRFPSASSEQR
jgi:hypothetical protein